MEAPVFRKWNISGLLDDELHGRMLEYLEQYGARG